MTEGIEYHPLGTIDVTFDDKTYHLRRPKMGQFRYFTRRLDEITRKAQEKYSALQAGIAEAAKQHQEEETPEAQAEIDRLSAEVKAFRDDPFYDQTAVVIAEMFSQIGDPLPDDTDDWPAWLAADSTLPGEILKHWRSNPKASGAAQAG